MHYLTKLHVNSRKIYNKEKHRIVGNISDVEKIIRNIRPNVFSERQLSRNKRVRFFKLI